MVQDLISVIMTAYNEEKYITEAIESILAQTYENFELIIVDDGSTDSTPTIIKQFKDSRIRYYQLSENRGVGAAHAYAIERAVGKFIAIADADDIHYPERLARQYNYLKEHEHLSVVDSYVNYFADNEDIKNSARYRYITNYRQKHLNSIHTAEEYKRSLYWFCSVVHSACMFYKDLIQTFSYSEFKVIEDYELFYNMNKQGILFGKVPEILVDVRITSNSTTLAQDGQLINNFFKIKEKEIDYLLKNNLDIYIWGTGQGGTEAAQILAKRNINIAGFLDNNSQKFGEIIDGIPVINHQNIKACNSGILIVSSIGKFDIVKQLEARGFKEFDDFLVLL